MARRAPLGERSESRRTFSQSRAPRKQKLRNRVCPRDAPASSKGIDEDSLRVRAATPVVDAINIRSFVRTYVIHLKLIFLYMWQLCCIHSFYIIVRIVASFWLEGQVAREQREPGGRRPQGARPEPLCPPGLWTPSGGVPVGGRPRRIVLSYHYYYYDYY